jgi:ubiquinone/menaquinone biosynthesis C-methylase UbiE
LQTSPDTWPPAVRLWWKLIRFGFRLLYNEMAWTYDLVSWTVSLGQWRTWQRAALRYLTEPGSGIILELAHGTGDLQIDLAGAGHTAIGIDLSRTMGRIASRKLRRRGTRPALARARAMQLPFAAGQFPAVVATFPTEFIIRRETLAEVARVLRPGGRLIVVVNGSLVSRSVVARFIEWLYTITGQRGPWPGDPLTTARECGFSARMVVDELPTGSVTLAILDRLA